MICQHSLLVDDASHPSLTVVAVCLTAVEPSWRLIFDSELENVGLSIRQFIHVVETKLGATYVLSFSSGHESGEESGVINGDAWLIERRLRYGVVLW